MRGALLWRKYRSNNMGDHSKLWAAPSRDRSRMGDKTRVKTILTFARMFSVELRLGAYFAPRSEIWDVDAGRLQQG